MLVYIENRVELKLAQIFKIKIVGSLNIFLIKLWKKQSTREFYLFILFKWTNLLFRLTTTKALGDPTLDPPNGASLDPDGHQLSLITGLLVREREGEAELTGLWTICCQVGLARRQE